MLPKAILFDLDDTILSDDEVSEEAWKESCKICADKLKIPKSSDLFQLINSERISFWSDPVKAREGARNLFNSRLTIVKRALHKLGLEDDEVAREIVTTYNTFKTELVRLLPNAERTLNELKTRGIKLALLTNGEAENQRAKVEKVGLGVHFPICLIEGELGFGKPDPRIFQLALDKLQVSAAYTWMVGDRLEFDILGAQNVGISGVWCDYSRKGLAPDSQVIPDAIINDISEILTLVDNKL